jgi:transketolase
MCRIADLPVIAKAVRHRTACMIAEHGGHPGGALSCVDVLVALYFHVMTPDDAFILSVGHYCPAWYATLAEVGFFDTAELDTFRQVGSRLQGHPRKGAAPGLANSAGSLGQGLSVAIGVALARKRAGEPSRVYCLMGDGEQQEGQVWEAAELAGRLALDNLCVVVDYNGIQGDGRTLQSATRIGESYYVRRWRVRYTDGHRYANLVAALGQGDGRPVAVIAYTTAAKGIPGLEGRADAHGARVEG